MAAPAQLDYAPPPEVDAAEAAAVWRVAWWAALIWATAEVAFWLPLTYQSFDEALRGKGYPWITIVYRSLVVARFALCGLLATLLLLRRWRAVAFWIAVGLVGLVAAYGALPAAAYTIYGGPLLGGVFIGLDVVAEAGGLLLFLAVAGRLVRADRRRMVLVTATPLLGASVYRAIITVVGVVGSLRAGEALDFYFRADQIVEHAKHALLLAAAVILVLAADSARRRPFVAVALLTATAYCGGYAADCVLYPDGYFDNGLLATLLDSTRSVTWAAPALALLAWRPPEALEKR